MLPKTIIGWTILVIVVAILIWGAGGAGTHLAHGVHTALTGVRAFFAGIGSA